MSDTVDGPDAAAFALPNAIEIAKLQVQINRLKDAEGKADGPRRRHVIGNQIRQLRRQQEILYAQIHGVSGAELDNVSPLDLAAILGLLKKEEAVLASQQASGPIQTQRIKELHELIDVVAKAQNGAAPPAGAATPDVLLAEKSEAYESGRA